jgi:beta-glucanase (GH16 family)
MGRSLFSLLAGTALVGLCLIAGPTQAESQPQPAKEPDHAPAGYVLVFGDEFDTGTMPDPARWDYATERNAEGWFNQEKQYYARARPENSRIEGGRLIIEARAETLDRAQFPDWGGQKFTSARLLTRGKASWTYGFFEIRAKLPCGIGTWPAIWTLPEDPKVEWPNGGEIDIMEHVGFEPGMVNQTVHTRAFNFGNGTQKTTKFAVPGACDAMHRYQLLWTPDFILMGVDDQPKFMFRKVRADRPRWPFDQPQHLLLNIAVGGSWGGQKGIKPEAFPARMEVDYVRIYQLPNPTK